MIELLTKEQEEQLAAYRDKWIRIGLCTKPANRKKAELAMMTAYKAAGLSPPVFVWCSSPIAMAITRAIVIEIMKDKSVRASVRDSVWDSVGASVRDSVWASVRASVGASVGASVRASVWDSVRDSVWASVRDSVWDSVGASVRDSVRDSVWGSVRDSVYGQHDAHWLGFYEFFRNVTNLISETRPVDGLIEFAQHAGWAIPHEKICWISERTEIVCQDDQKRLHCINGPAVRYPDGWELYYLWGVKVPREWIMQSPNEMNVAQFASIKNAEQRAVYIRKMGIHKLYDHGTIIHSQEGYDLVDMQTLLDLDRPAPYLFMTNPSTGEKHAEGVAPECRTVDEAINWRAGGVRWAPEILT